MNLKSTRTFLGVLLAATALLALTAGSAIAAPQWKFNETTLTGEETIMGAAEKSSLDIIGMKTTCDNFLYEIDIKNSGGTGAGKSPTCPCSTATPTVSHRRRNRTWGFPWGANLKTKAAKTTSKVKGVQVSIVYGDPNARL